MQKFILSLGCAALLASVSAHGTSCRETLTEKTDTFLEVTAANYDRLRAKDFAHALDIAFPQVAGRIAALSAQTETPTFANTILAIENVFYPVERVNTVLDNYLNAKSDADLRQLEKQNIQRVSDLEGAFYFDAKIFARVKRVYDSMDQAGLNAEQTRLTQKIYDAFVKRGAALGANAQQEVKAVTARLQELGAKFSENKTKDTNENFFAVDRLEDLDGLDETQIRAAKKLAVEQGQPEKWLFSQRHSDYMTILARANRRDVRERYWRFNAAGGERPGTDNRPLVLEIAKLRQRYAQIMGYPSYSAMILRERMAKTPEKVLSFMDKKATEFRQGVPAELDELRRLAGHEIAPWDNIYYSQKLQSQNISIDMNALKSYFPYNQVLQGLFQVIEKLYGVTFHSRADLPVWAEGVTAYDVRDGDGSYLGRIYLDLYERDSKRAGAWNSQLTRGGLVEGHLERPEVVNVLNLKPPVDGEPLLLSLDEVRTVYHEMGHALHGLLSRANYASLFGTNVAWDFVELPSQILELWAVEPEVLKTYARDVKTGQILPDKLARKIQANEKFQESLKGLGQVRYIAVDMAWHTRDLDGLVEAPEDVGPWEDLAIDPYRVFAPQGGASISSEFAHIFSGGYAAGYYSYMWSDVLAEDAFSVFKTHGIFDPATARSFRAQILERGDTDDPEILYRNFRGANNLF